jgi:hypothetical protein
VSKIVDYHWVKTNSNSNSNFERESREDDAKVAEKRKQKITLKAMRVLKPIDVI